MASYDLTRIPALRDLQELGRRQKNVTDGLGQRVSALLDRIALVAQTASKSIEEMEKTKADKVNIMSLTIPASGWSSDSTAGCPYYLDIPVSGLTANDCVAVVVAPTCAKTALTAGLTSTESFAGKLRLRAQQTPTAAITAVYYIVK